MKREALRRLTFIAFKGRLIPYNKRGFSEQLSI